LNPNSQLASVAARRSELERKPLRKRGRSALEFFTLEAIHKAEEESTTELSTVVSISEQRWARTSKEERQPFIDLALEDMLIVEQQKANREEALFLLDLEETQILFGTTESSEENTLGIDPVRSSGKQIAARSVTRPPASGNAAHVINFFSLSELTWQELLIEVLCRVERRPNPHSEAAVQVNSSPSDEALDDENRESDDGNQEEQSKSNPNRSRRERNILKEDDVSAYDLVVEEAKELEYWGLAITATPGDSQTEDDMDVENTTNVGVWNAATFTEECERLIEALLSHPLASPFAEPVTPDMPGLRTYLKTISEPISLSEVLERVRTGFYAVDEDTLELLAFREDVMRIWSNAKQFYKETSTEYEDAQHLEHVFLERFARLTEADANNKAMREEKIQNRAKCILTKPQEESKAENEAFLMSFPAQKLIKAGVNATKMLVGNAKLPEEEIKRQRYKYPKKVLALRALATVLEQPGAEYFRDPVDTSKPGMEDYDALVPKRVDLGTIYAKAQRSYYDYYAARERAVLAPKFVKDVRLCFSNCELFNPQDSEIVQAGRRLDKLFLDIILNDGLEALASQEKVTLAASAAPNEQSDNKKVNGTKPEALASVAELGPPEQRKASKAAAPHSTSRS